MVGIDPADLGPDGSYRLMTGLVVPRPIGWIGTVGSDGVRNLAPYSFFNVVTGWPPTVVFSGVDKSGEPKDTMRNVISTGEFTLSVVSMAVAEQMNQSSAPLPAHVDEFVAVGLTPVSGEIVSAPWVGEAVASMECRLVQTVPVGLPPRTATLAIGEVVRFHVAEGLVSDGRVDQAMLDAVGRLHGPGYTSTRDRFDLTRPT